VILLRIRDGFVFSQHIFLPYAAIIFFATLVYRMSVFIMITARYAELRDLAFSAYFFSSFPSDAPVLLAALLGLSILCVALSETEMAKFIAASLFSWLYLCACLLGVEFFRVYETPFHGAFIGGENFTGPVEVLLSAAAEISAPFIGWTMLFTAVIAASAAFLYRRDRGIYYDGESIGLFFRGMAGLHAGIMILLAVVSVTGTNASPDPVIAAGKDISSPVTPGLIRELSANPLANLATGDWRGGNTENRNVPLPARGDIILPETIHGEGGEIPASLTIPRGRRYNIILYIFESFPSEYLSLEAGGRPVTGTWTRLAQNGFSALNHYANNPLSANALLSILASVHEPYGRGLLIQDEPRAPVATLSEILKSAGYRTCHIHSGGLAYAGQNRFLKHRGYDTVMDYFQLKKFSPRSGTVGWGIDERAMIGPAVEFMKAANGAPFFTVFQPVNPHHPYAIPGREFDIAGSGIDGEPQWKKSWRRYVNSLYYADTVLGLLVDRLEREGLMKNTLFILVADHGEAFYQHRQNYNHPFFIYEENVHVPLLVYNRDLFPRPATFDGITRHVDIAPTVLDLLGLGAHPLHQGVSLASRRRSQRAMLHTAWRDDYRGMRDGRWKYIIRRRDGFEELYDLSKDRAERVNLAGMERGVCARCREALAGSEAYRAAYYEKLRVGGTLSRSRGNGISGAGMN
jgi:arylsulfatase A-like enzyme